MAISNTPLIPFSPEALQFKTKQGMGLSMSGVTYVQYAASDAVTNAGPSTILKASAGSKGSLTFPAGFFNWNNGYDPVGVAPNATSAGCRVRVTLQGTLVCSATPNLTLLAKFTNGAGTAQTLATTGTVALAAITNGTTANTSPCFLTLDMLVSSYGSTGTIITRGEFRYSTAPLTGIAPVSIMIPGGTAETAVSSYDLTQILTLDIQATVSASTASLTINNALIEVMN